MVEPGDRPSIDALIGQLFDVADLWQENLDQPGVSLLYSSYLWISWLAKPTICIGNT